MNIALTPNCSQPIYVPGDDRFHLAIIEKIGDLCYNEGNMAKLPENFRPILWSYDFEKCDPEKMKNTIIVNAVSYGDLNHWRWLKSFYGTQDVQKVLDNISVSAVRPSAMKLAKIMFGS